TVRKWIVRSFAFGGLGLVVVGIGALGCSSAPADAERNESASAAWTEPSAPSARDMSPDGPTFPGGRVVAVPSDPPVRTGALALAQNGGVFGSIDGGQTWAGNVLADGTPGPFGRGLEGHAIAQFDDLAIDPLDGKNVLVFASDDGRGKPSGIWR